MSLSDPRNIDDNKLEMSKSNAFVQQRYQTLFNLQYFFMIKTEAIFEPEKRDYVFDFFILDDSKFDEFYLFKNIWRETLLLNSLNKKGFSNKINSVHNFGILPNKIIFREIEEISCISLEKFIKQKDNFASIKENDNESSPDKLRSERNLNSGERKNKILFDDDQQYISKQTYFSEVEAINIILKFIDLIQILHSQNIIHASFNPSEIYLKDKSLDKIFFMNLYYCSWDTFNTIGLMLPEDGDNLSIFDTRVRIKSFIAPEQIKLGLELDMILSGHNGKLDETNPVVLEYHLANKAKINKQCDIYAVGAILYRLLMANPPNLSISQYIAKKRLNQKSPDSNVYEFLTFSNYILSNDMCYLFIRLLHQNLKQVKEELLKLRENIYSTPPVLRKILGHPILPNESYQQQAPPKIIEFKNSKMNEFSLKYLAKFINEQNVEQISINGGAMPLMPLKNHLLIELNLRDQNLFSEDWFILSKFLRHNNSVTHINLSKQLYLYLYIFRNSIGYKNVEESKVIEMKMKHQDKLKNFF